MKKGEEKVDKERFVTSAISGLVMGGSIITDTETGVQYLFVLSGYGGGLTALLDSDGKPLLNKRIN